VSRSAEQEIRDEFEEWFRDAANRDVDALMTKIAEDAHSFEHQTPLEYVGADAIRRSYGAAIASTVPTYACVSGRSPYRRTLAGPW
jgi:ketosteroid isomerase-like protein